jgi:hypothetical protein
MAKKDSSALILSNTTSICKLKAYQINNSNKFHWIIFKVISLQSLYHVWTNISYFYINVTSKLCN